MTSAAANLAGSAAPDARVAGTRRGASAWALGYLLVVGWFSLTPFDFGSSPVGQESLTRIGLPLAAVHRPDALANVALFVPLGLLLRVMLLRRGWSEAGSLLAAVGIAGAAAYGIEWAQRFSASRVSSVADLTCNVAGALIGAALVSAARASGAALLAVQGRVIRDWEEDVRKRPSGVAARLMAAGLLLAAMAPFDVTFSINRLVESARSANLTPFGQNARPGEAIAPAVPDQSSIAVNKQARDRVQLALDGVWVVCGYAVLAVFVRRYLVAHCRMTALAALVWTVAACVMLAAACFLAQMLIISRASDVTDVVLAAVGAMIGAAVSARLIAAWRDDADEFQSVRARIVLAGLVACGAFVCARQLAPFRPQLSTDSIIQGIASIEWLPMAAYQRARLPVAMDDLLSKLGMFAAIGAAAAWRRWLMAAAFDRGYTVRLALVVVAGMAVLESVQILLPSRMPSVTDLLIAAAGVPIGVGVFRYVMTTYEAVMSRGQTEFDRVIYNVEFDAAQPAPVEQVPQRQRISETED